MSRATKDRTYLPDDFVVSRSSSGATFSEVEEQLARHGARLLLRSGDQECDLPREYAELLLHIVTALNQGKGVTVVAHNQEVSTQEAADLLGISRPTVVRLCEEGAIPFRKTNRHRRLYLRDVIDYRDRQRVRSDAILSEMVADSQELDLYSIDLDEAAAKVRSIREKA